MISFGLDGARFSQVNLSILYGPQEEICGDKSEDISC
jgi:hypothetical protein